MDGLMHVLSICDTEALLLCATTCSLMRSAVAAEFRLRLAMLLVPFFGDRVRHWFGLLRLHGAIVSGSVALALFLHPIEWVPGDLDVYISDKAYSLFVYDLERLFPVVLEADMSRSHPGIYTGIKRVRRYKTATGKRLEVIQSRSSSSVAPLLYFWSSLVVNFITPHGAVCAFPKHTLGRAGLIAEATLHLKALRARDKYEDRGISFTEDQMWWPGGGQQDEQGSVFSDGPLLILDFRTVWPNQGLRLPICRVGSKWTVTYPPADEAGE